MGGLRVNEHELLKSIAAQDETALRELHDSYYKRLGSFLLRLTGDSELVAELINDVFMVVWQKASTFRGDSAPSTWIMGIAHNKAMKALRSRRTRFREEPLDPDDAAVAKPETSVVEDPYAMLRKLAPKHRAVIVLTYQYGYSYQEISQVLSCPVNTVKTRMYHARRNLQALMEAS